MGFDDTIGDDATLKGLVQGLLLDERYELFHELGRGGMGVVWLARDLERGGELVAVKVLPELIAHDEASIDRLMQEANVAMRLSHPGIMRLHNFERHERKRFLVMEYLAGPTLRELIRLRNKTHPEASRPLFSETEVIELARCVGQSLQYAHSQRIVHRDLKPANLMFAHAIEDPCAPLDFQANPLMICDFGIARVLEDSHTHLSGQPTTGTLLYMSPEQIRGRGIGPASDIYSMGCMLYECLDGRPPFYTGSIMHQHLEEPPQTIKGISPPVWGAVARCLEKDSAKRFSSADQIASAMEDDVDGPCAESSKSAGIRRHDSFAIWAACLSLAILAIGGGWWIKQPSPSLMVAYRSDNIPVESTPTSPPKPTVTPAVTPSPEATENLTLVVKALTKDFTVDLGGGVKLEMVWIQGGSFMMGSPETEEGRQTDEGPVHEVELDGFWMGKYEVTVGQYEEILDNNPSKIEGANNPVEMVSWNDAMEFCQRLSKSTGKDYHLPTEAQWEYACRAGSRSRFCFGDSDSGLGDYGWYMDNSGKKTHAVGGKKPNAWGLYDMHGSVYEWCVDWKGNYSSEKQRNPTGPGTGSHRVLRGGSWGDYPWHSRSAFRHNLTPSTRHYGDGFRVVCVAWTQ